MCSTHEYSSTRGAANVVSDDVEDGVERDDGNDNGAKVGGGVDDVMNRYRHDDEMRAGGDDSNDMRRDANGDT
jgi:hypothetical protein